MLQAKSFRVLFAVLPVGLAACGQLPPDPAVNSQTREIAQAQAKLTTANSTSRGAVDRFVGPKLAGREIRLAGGYSDTSAAWLQEPFIYVSDSQNLADVLQAVSEQVEHRIRIGSMDDDWNDGSKLKANFPVDWRKGNLGAFLGYVASRMNANWKLVDGDIEFFQNETRSFQVSLPPGSRTMTSSLNLGTSGGGSGGGSGSQSGAQSSVSSTLTINTFDAVLNGVKALVGTSDAAGSGGQGGGATQGGKGNGKSTVVGNPELGLITVTGRPRVLDRVARHVESINERVAQNVFVQIKVMSVALDNSDFVNLGLDGILSRGLNQIGLKSPGASSAGSGAPGFMTLKRVGGSAAGSEVVFGLLKQAGEVSIVRSGQVIAANGQPAGMQIADEVNYLAQVSTSVVANAGAQTSLTPGSRTVGFTASVLPLILADNRLLLQYTLNLSSLLALTQNSSGGQTIQTPQISSQTLQQQAYVGDGESIVLFGFEQDRNTSDRALGIASAGVNQSRQRQAMVIVMDVSRVGSRQ